MGIRRPSGAKRHAHYRFLFPFGAGDPVIAPVPIPNMSRDTHRTLDLRDIGKQARERRIAGDRTRASIWSTTTVLINSEAAVHGHPLLAGSGFPPGSP